MRVRLILRRLASTILTFAALLLFVLAVTTPIILREDAADNRALEAEFRRAAALATAFERRHGRLPESDELRSWATHRGMQRASSLSINSDGCIEEGLVRAPSDRFHLSVWQGEFSDCYAAPSGRHTLSTSVLAFLRTGAGAMIAVLLAIAAALAWVSARLTRRQSRPDAAA